MQFQLRPFVPSDLPGLLAVHAACRERDRIDPHSVCYRLPNLSPERYAREVALCEAAMVAEIDGKIVAHGLMEVWGIEERCYLWQVWVDPAVRNQGIGTHLLTWGERTARQRHQGRSEPASHLANATEQESDAIALLGDHGYELRFVSIELAFDASMTIPDARDIPGIAFSPLDHAETDGVAYALSEANQPEGNDAERNERIAAEEPKWRRRIDDCAAELSFVAKDKTSGEIVGAYLCQRNDGSVGEIAQVAVRASWRNRGIARSLAMRSLAALRSSGCTTVRLFTSIGPHETDPTDGPYAMYRKFGFYPIARHLRFRKSMSSL